VLSSLHNNFLATLNETWSDYIAVVDDIQAVFWYMEKYYALRNNLENVHNLGPIIFRDQVFIQPNMLTAGVLGFAN